MYICEAELQMVDWIGLGNDTIRWPSRSGRVSFRCRPPCKAEPAKARILRNKVIQSTV